MVSALLGAGGWFRRDAPQPESQTAIVYTAQGCSCVYPPLARRPGQRLVSIAADGDLQTGDVTNFQPPIGPGSRSRSRYGKSTPPTCSGRYSDFNSTSNALPQAVVSSVLRSMSQSHSSYVDMDMDTDKSRPESIQSYALLLIAPEWTRRCCRGGAVLVRSTSCPTLL